MKFIRICPQLRAFFIFLAASITLGLSICTGCNRPVSAPAIEYDQAAADVLRERLGKMDWE